MEIPDTDYLPVSAGDRTRRLTAGGVTFLYGNTPALEQRAAFEQMAALLDMSPQQLATDITSSGVDFEQRLSTIRRCHELLHSPPGVMTLLDGALSAYRDEQREIRLRRISYNQPSAVLPLSAKRRAKKRAAVDNIAFVKARQPVLHFDSASTAAVSRPSEPGKVDPEVVASHSEAKEDGQWRLATKPAPAGQSYRSVFNSCPPEKLITGETADKKVETIQDLFDGDDDSLDYSDIFADFSRVPPAGSVKEPGGVKSPEVRRLDGSDLLDDIFS